jgi:hypothetical protein
MAALFTIEGLLRFLSVIWEMKRLVISQKVTLFASPIHQTDGILKQLIPFPLSEWSCHFEKIRTVLNASLVKCTALTSLSS